MSPRDLTLSECPIVGRFQTVCFYLKTTNSGQAAFGEMQNAAEWQKTTHKKFMTAHHFSDWFRYLCAIAYVYWRAYGSALRAEPSRLHVKYGSEEI